MDTARSLDASAVRLQDFSAPEAASRQTTRDIDVDARAPSTTELQARETDASGAAETLFRGDIGQALGIQVEDGIKGEAGRIVPGAKLDVFYHPVNLWVGADMIRIIAGFAPRLSIGALLGRNGFFEHFIVTFDPSNNPPGFEITQLGRA